MYSNATATAHTDLPLPHEPAAFRQQVAQALAHDLALLLQPGDELARYALVELGQCTPEDQQVIAYCVKALGLNIKRLFAGTPENDLADQGPWLISLPVNAEPALLQALALHAGLSHALSIIASPLVLSEMADHMRGWLEGLIPADPGIEGDEPSGAVLRWFDPRIGLDMIGSLPAPDRRQFMGAMRWWASWSHDFTPRVVYGPVKNVVAPRVEPLPLDMPLLRALDQLNTAETMLASIRENDIEPGELDAVAPALQHWLAHRLLATAKQMGLEDWSNQYMLVAMGLRLNCDVAHCTALQEVFRAAAAGNRPLTEAIGDLPPALVNELAQQAPKALARNAQLLLEELHRRSEAPARTHPFHILLTEAH